jgi:hypothetical protein
VEVRAAALAGLGTALAWWAVSSTLLVHPGRPMAARTDVFFQSDAGGIVADAVVNNTERSRGTHPLLYPACTRPLYELGGLLAPLVPREATATYGSRAIVNAGAGLGIAVLAHALLLRGLSWRRLAAAAPVLWLGSGFTLAAIPDHFGLGLGTLAAAFGFYLRDWPVRRKAIALALVALLAFGITVTNVLFPTLLLAAVLVRAGLPRWCYLAALFLGFFGAGSAFAFVQSRPDLQARIGERVEMYLTWNLTRNPGLAAVRTFRGTVDAAVAPTPSVSAESNLSGLPMLTYQPPGVPYPAWPYDAPRSFAAACWLALLTIGIATGLRHRPDREPLLLLWLWVSFNAVLHNIWGDEYFLYSPHYAWALLAAAVLGWSRQSGRIFTGLCLGTAAGASLTLLEVRSALLGIAQ